MTSQMNDTTTENTHQEGILPKEVHYDFYSAQQYEIKKRNQFQIPISNLKVKQGKKKNQMDLAAIRRITKNVKEELNECLNEQQPSFGYPHIQF